MYFTYKKSYAVMQEPAPISYHPVWHQIVEGGFNDLIISWNAYRPSEGKFSFYVRVKDTEWSTWFCLATWGRNRDGSIHQRSFWYPKDSSVHLDVDTISLSFIAREFEVKVESEEGAEASSLHHLWASAALLSKKEDPAPVAIPDDRFVIPHVPMLSQIEIPHPKAGVMCSPTSTWMVLCHLNQYCASVHDVSFADFTEAVYDQHKQIYGNWVLNVAAAYEELEGRFCAYACRMSGFEALSEYLRKGIPAVVSIKGPIKGASEGYSYSDGHLMVVKGWDGKKRQVICIDPAFPHAHETEICYDVTEFMTAWNRRFNLAYLWEIGAGSCITA